MFSSVTSSFPLTRLPVAFLNVVCEMAPYLLLGFLIAGVLHVFVPQKFYANYLSRNNKLSVLWAALLGIPLPLCSCGVIPTAVGLKNEKAVEGIGYTFKGRMTTIYGPRN